MFNHTSPSWHYYTQSNTLPLLNIFLKFIFLILILRTFQKVSFRLMNFKFPVAFKSCHHIDHVIGATMDWTDDYGFRSGLGRTTGFGWINCIIFLLFSKNILYSIQAASKSEWLFESKMFYLLLDMQISTFMARGDCNRTEYFSWRAYDLTIL